jgi:hypothetical protein
LNESRADYFFLHTKPSSCAAPVIPIFGPKLFGVCIKYARNSDEAKDHLQESFLLIFKI